MREWCGCGAAIHSLSKRTVTKWRDNHFHDGKPEPEPDKQGSESRVETAYRPAHTDDGERRIPDVNAKRIGFTA